MQLDANPFSTKFWTPGAIPYVFDDADGLEEFARRRERLPVAQVVGPHGSGKSTLLETLAGYERAKGTTVLRAMLNDRQRKLPEDFVSKNPEPGTLFLLDGYERLSLRDRFRLRRVDRSKTRGLVWTTHRPVRGVPVLYRTVPRYERFVELVRRLTKGSPTIFDEPFLRDLFERSGGHFRTAFFELYDGMEEPASAPPVSTGAR